MLMCNALSHVFICWYFFKLFINLHISATFYFSSFDICSFINTLIYLLIHPSIYPYIYLNLLSFKLIVCIIWMLHLFMYNMLPSETWALGTHKTCLQVLLYVYKPLLRSIYSFFFLFNLFDFFLIVYLLIFFLIKLIFFAEGSYGKKLLLCNVAVVNGPSDSKWSTVVANRLRIPKVAVGTIQAFSHTEKRGDR